MTSTHNLNFYWQERQQNQHVIRAVFQPEHSSLPLVTRRECYQDGMDTGLHWHEDFYAIYIVQGGRGTHIINRHPYVITRGDVYVMPPGSIHAYRDYRDLYIDAFYFQPQLFSNAELVALQSMSGFWQLLLPATLLSDESTNCAISPEPHSDSGRPAYDHRFHVSPECHHDIQEMIEEIRTEFVTASLEAAILTRNQFFRMLVYLARRQSAIIPPHPHLVVYDVPAVPDKPEQQTPHGIGLARVLQLCEERFSEPLTVPQLAALMFLSPSRFTEIFTQQVGVSPAAYIRRLRLERAQTLLRTTTHPISTIAHHVGFGDSAQFTRAFQAVFHMTPTQYRGQFKSG